MDVYLMAHTHIITRQSLAENTISHKAAGLGVCEARCFVTGVGAAAQLEQLADLPLQLLLRCLGAVARSATGPAAEQGV